METIIKWILISAFSAWGIWMAFNITFILLELKKQLKKMEKISNGEADPEGN
jgi:hypothetical protein